MQIVANAVYAVNILNSGTSIWHPGRWRRGHGLFRNIQVIGNDVGASNSIAQEGQTTYLSSYGIAITAPMSGGLGAQNIVEALNYAQGLPPIICCDNVHQRRLPRQPRPHRGTELVTCHRRPLKLQRRDLHDACLCEMASRPDDRRGWWWGWLRHVAWERWQWRQHHIRDIHGGRRQWRDEFGRRHWRHDIRITDHRAARRLWRHGCYQDEQRWRYRWGRPLRWRW